MIDDTVFKNIVRERRMVTPIRKLNYNFCLDNFQKFFQSIKFGSSLTRGTYCTMHIKVAEFQTFAQQGL